MTASGLRRLASIVLAAAPLTAVAAEPADLDIAFVRLASDAGQGKPLYRIGLESAHRIMISSGSSFRIVDPATGKAVSSWFFLARCRTSGTSRGERAIVWSPSRHRSPPLVVAGSTR